MSGRRLNGQQQNAMFTMRHRHRTDLRALASSGVTEAEMDDLVKDGYVEVSDRKHLAWRLTTKGMNWVDRHLPKLP